MPIMPPARQEGSVRRHGLSCAVRPSATRRAGRGRRPLAVVAAVLAALLMLAGCAASADRRPARHPAGSGHAPGGSGHDRASPGHGPAGTAGAGRAGTGLAELRSALTRPGGGAYYLSLGDSLARGLQPGPAGGDMPTARGYPDRLAARLRSVLPGLRLVKLGCPGETTVTMIHGGVCRYPAGSQLGQAVRFLRSHRGRIALVTIDIGGNDPNSCVLGAQPLTIPGCLYRRVPRIVRNLTAILAGLRSAGGPRVPIVGMTYYVPELGLWHRDLAGRQIALITDGFALGVNKLLIARYHRAGARVADVFGAFHSTDFGSALTRGLPAGVTPPNVAAVCALTWMCAAPPRGPNEHPNNAGYGVIADAFWRAIAG